MSRYAQEFQRSLADPEGFWADAARDIDWYQAPTVVLDRSRAPFYRWFADGVLNTCFNAVDRHVRDGRGQQPALIYDSPVTGSQRTYTYAELRDEVARFAGVLRGLGVGQGRPGDRVPADDPGGADRHAGVRQDRGGALGGVRRLRGARTGHADRRRHAEGDRLGVVRHRGQPRHRVQADPGPRHRAGQPQAGALRGPAAAGGDRGPDRRGATWTGTTRRAKPNRPTACRWRRPIRCTSCTRRAPRPGPRAWSGTTAGTRSRCAGACEAIYDTEPGEVFWAASDVGWVVGHSYIVYAPLLAGCTTILYEGKPVGTPDAGAFWRVVAEHNVKALFTAPTAFRAIKKEDPRGELAQRYDLSGFRYLFLAGERLDPETYRWASELLGIPVIDHWWQTETGWPIVADLMGLEPMPTKAGSPTMPVPGYDVRILGADGTEAKPGETGDIVVRLPLPPGCLPTLWQDDERFVASYLSAHPGCYTTGDGGYRDDDGYVYVMGRVDDVINVAGHRLSTGQMEEVLASHPAVAECAVIGVHDDTKGQVPRGFVVLKAGVGTEPAVVSAELVQLIRERIGAVAALRRVDVVAGLPKTRSGKILRKTMRGIADGTDEPVPSTIEDPAVLDALRPVLSGD